MSGSARSGSAPTEPMPPTTAPDTIQDTMPDTPPAGTSLCTLADLPAAGGRVFSFGEPDNPFRVIAVQHDGQVQAWHNRCPHFGLPLAEKDEWLLLKPGLSLSCNVHYARFRWEDGVCEFGDCEGEQLTRISIKIQNGEVVFGENQAKL